MQSRNKFLCTIDKFTRAVVIIFSLCTLTFSGWAQQFGGNPASLQWSQINTDTVRIIFPAGLDAAAKRIAAVALDLQKYHTGSIGQRLRKINIVLQNQGTISNGYVSLGPYRSEFFLFAPQNSFELGALYWPDQLALHEYRHVQQYSNFRVGLSKTAAILFGQQGQDFANSAAVPNWFFEGDAVFNETSLSTQGRGRLPYFLKNYQALNEGNKQYSYMKLRNGSLRDFVPDHYSLGYLLVAYGRQQYGDEFWKNVSRDAAAFNSLVYPWQSAVKKHAGISYRQFVKNAFAFYDKQWNEAKGLTIKTLTRQNKDAVTDYKYPYATEEGGLVVLRRSYRHIPTLVEVSKRGKEKTIAVRDLGNDDYFSYKNGRLIFTTYKADRRWGYREFSDIKIVDLVSGNHRVISHKQRYFSPDISHDGNKIITVESRTNQMSDLVALDSNGNTIFRSQAVRGRVYTYPKFLRGDSSVYTFVRRQDGEMAIIKVTLSNGQETIVLPFANRIIGYPTVQGDTLLFSCSYLGSDEIWAHIASSATTYRLAKEPTGLYQGIFNKNSKELISSHFTAEGYQLISIPQDSLLWQPVNKVEDKNALPDLYVAKALAQEPGSTLEKIAPQDFVVTKYSKATNLLNFHSWRPYFDDPEITYSIIGENVLNTLQTELSYTYNYNEGSHRAGLNTIYGGWYIQPTLGVNYTWGRDAFYNADTTFSYNEMTTNVGLRLPLNFSARQAVSLPYGKWYHKQ